MQSDICCDCISLYIHIPFCLAKCDYCDFFSVERGSSVPDEYVDALLNEISFYKNYYHIQNFKTVYIGGGTPSLLSPAQFFKLLSHIQCNSFEKPSEITVEMNPETLTEGKLSAVSDCGANRLSLGIQSLNDDALCAVHRHCSSSSAHKALDIVKKYWKHDLNLDVIAGLCRQSNNQFLASLKEILYYQPEHISMYTLMIEEGTRLFQRIEDGENWSEDLADEQWLLGKELLDSNGFLQYEISNFAKAGHESLHNMTYWKQNNYLGIGSGACGSVYGFGVDGGVRWNNRQDIDSYINFWTHFDKCDVLDLPEESIKQIPRDIEQLSCETEEFEFLMMGLRTVYGVSSSEYRKRFADVEPWKGDLSFRLGEHNGAWKRFSAHNDCHVICDEIGQDRVFTLNGESLMFLNTFLNYLT